MNGNKDYIRFDRSLHFPVKIPCIYLKNVIEIKTLFFGIGLDLQTATG